MKAIVTIIVLALAFGCFAVAVIVDQPPIWF